MVSYQKVKPVQARPFISVHLRVRVRESQKQPYLLQMCMFLFPHAQNSWYAFFPVGAEEVQSAQHKTKDALKFGGG